MYALDYGGVIERVCRERAHLALIKSDQLGKERQRFYTEVKVLAAVVEQVIQRTIFLTLLMTEIAMTLARGSALPGVRRARTTCIALRVFCMLKVVKATVVSRQSSMAHLRCSEMFM